jgi:chorismate mutase
MGKVPDLDLLRAALDVSNRRLAQVLHERLRLVRQAAAWKAQRGLPLADPVRERAMLAQVATWADPEGCDAATLQAVFAAVLAAGRAQLERCGTDPC